MQRDLLPVRIDDMITEIERELLLRRRVYANRVHTGRLSQRRADRQVEVLQAILLLVQSIRDTHQLPEGLI
jgi:hypothetical protein